MNVCKLVRKTLGNDLTKNQKQLAEEGKQLEGKYFTEKYSKTNEGYILEHQYWEFKKIILKNTIIGIPATTNQKKETLNITKIYDLEGHLIELRETQHQDKTTIKKYHPQHICWYKKTTIKTPQF